MQAGASHFSEPGLSDRLSWVQVTMMHEYNAETVGQWLQYEDAAEPENVDFRWLPPVHRSPQR